MTADWWDVTCPTSVGVLMCAFKSRSALENQRFSWLAYGEEVPVLQVREPECCVRISLLSVWAVRMLSAFLFITLLADLAMIGCIKSRVCFPVYV